MTSLAPEGRRRRALLASLVAVHVIAISHQVDTGGGVSRLERAVLALLSPPQRAVTAIVDGVRNAWLSYVDLRRVRHDNQALQQHVHTLQVELQRARQGAREAERLRELLDLRQHFGDGARAATVVGRSGLPWFRTLLVNRGGDHGVQQDAPVISPEGVVGRVIAVTAAASKVQVLLDHHSGMGALVERTRVAGIVAGQVGAAEADRGELLMRYVPVRADVRPGDTVLTSGLDEIYPKGLLVGHVSSVQPASGLFQDVRVTPAVDFSRIEEVLLLPAKQNPPLRADVTP